MNNFTFRNPTKILFGKGQIAALDSEIPAAAKLLITYGGGSAERNGTLDEVRAALGTRAVLEFGGIEPNPTFETLMGAVELARREQVTWLLAVGGGSVIDGTKFIAAAVPFAGDPWQIVATRAVGITAALPFATVLTLPATGSEMDSSAVISRRETTDKLGLANPLLFPRVSVLDPTRTFGLPPRQIANGVIDAFAHVMEQYLTYPVNSPVQDRLAEGLLLTLIEEGPKTLAEPDNTEARANVMWCAALAQSGLVSTGVPGDWTSHAVGHELTALYGLDHAQSLAALLPAVMAERREAKREKLAQYAARVWGLADLPEAQAIDGAIARTRAFFASLGVATDLAGYGLDAAAIPAVLGQLRRHNRVQLGERGEVTLAVVEQILRRCA